LEGSLPAEPRLAGLAETLERTGWAIELFDASWRLVWVSDSVKAVLGESDEGRLGYGRHLVEAWAGDARRRLLTPESRARSLAELAALTLSETPGGKEALRRAMGERWPPELDPVTPSPAPELWSTTVEMVLPGATEPNRLQSLMVRCRHEEGTLTGTFFVHSSGLPAHIFALLVTGDEDLFRRAADLVEPRRHAAAIVFADLEASGPLASRLEARSYFELLRELLTGLDGLAAAHGGVVGKHGGDGATAFFLADQIGDRSTAARAALRVALEAPAVARRCEARATAAAGGLRLNVGVHWADRLYVGQVVTGGRLEVTAVGAEVNECARLQESARGGRALVSMALVDQLPEGERQEHGPFEFTALRELATAGEKATRDAGDLPVAFLRAMSSGADAGPVNRTRRRE
jgi:class 3 adenylate cyclase